MVGIGDLGSLGISSAVFRDLYGVKALESLIMFSNGAKEPTDSNRYLAKDGLYYNGYMGNPDAADDAFGDCFREIAEKLLAEIDPTPNSKASS